MGVSFDPGDASWSYGGFHQFRQHLAASEGIDLLAMQGFADEHGVAGTNPWDEETTPLAPLLNHSDCDGELTPEECARVAPRLREVLDSWERGHDPSDIGLRYDIRMGRKLAAAMEEVAAGDHDSLEFT